jgi:2-polyprenyl-3-methyl-5-hydroxy-6-metoxy-1,4-benzoquinol methylase
MAKDTAAAFGADQTATKDFMLTMNAAALEFAPDLIAVLTAQSAADRKLAILDVGCGLGTLSIFLSNAFRHATVEAFDLPGVSELADEFVRERSTEGRIRVFAADWRTWTWREKFYDLIILSQVLHEFSLAEAEELFRKASSALKPGGLLVTVIVGDATVPGGDYVHRLFAMNILVEAGGDNPNETWLAKMEGALRMQRTYFHRITGSRSLWVGRKIS